MSRRKMQWCKKMTELCRPGSTDPKHSTLAAAVFALRSAKTSAALVVALCRCGFV
jgi:hypothetical protein